MKISNKLYDVLKEFALVWIPALGTLYFGLSEIWNFPHGPEVVATLTVIDTFLGAVLHISNKTYKENE